MFFQYPLYNNKIFLYIKYALYKLNKRKLTFENLDLIDLKLFQLIFNYLKFYAITHFVYCIWDYNSAINHNTAYSKAIHKYFFKIFYD